MTDAVTKAWIRNASDERAAAAGYRFDPTRASYVVWWIENYCRLYEGEWAGEPMILRGCHEDLEGLPVTLAWDEGGKEESLLRAEIYAERFAAGEPVDWQYECTMRVFGWVGHSERWKREVRRFRKSATFVPKKSKKPMALNTPIPTPQGWRTMGTLEAGDEVFAEDGSRCTITNATEVYYGEDCYEITFSDDTSVTVGAGHEWFVHSKSKHKWMVCETEKMYRTQTTAGRANYRVEVNGPLDYDYADLPIDPYLLGAWLGDGSRGKGLITIGCDDRDGEILRTVQVAEHPITTSHKSTVGNTVAYHFSGLATELRRIGVLFRKHIPRQYLCASLEQRTRLLHGLMDTDGCCGPKGQCVISTVHEGLRDGLVELLRSLGYKPTCGIINTSCPGFSGTAWVVRFAADETNNVFSMARKQAKLPPQRPDTRRSKNKTITSITKVESVPVRCITVDSPSHLFIAGRGMIPTHNSPTLAAWGLYLLAGDGEQGQKVFIAAKDGSQARDIAGQHAVEMVNQSEDLLAVCKINMNEMRITHLPSRSFMKPLSSNDSRSQQAKEGLNGSLMVDECFTEGTEILTPTGMIPIDKVRPGCRICHAAGIGTVLGTVRRQVDTLYRLEYSDGTTLHCTASHPIFTGRGWIEAGQLAVGSVAYRQQDVQALWRDVLSASVEEQGRQDICSDREFLERPGILLDILRQEVCESNVCGSGKGESIANASSHRTQAAGAGRKREAAFRTAGGAASSTWDGMEAGVFGGNGNEKEERTGWIPNLLQDRHSQPGETNCNRSGRAKSQQRDWTQERRQEGCFPAQPRLVRVSRIKCPCPVAVFNLRVSGHPSYFANGLLVHNCHVVDREFMNRVKRLGISRSEPLVAMFSTSGNDPEGFGKEQFDYGGDVLSGQREDHQYFAAIYAAPQEMTDADLEADPVKFGRIANPAWGHTIGEDEYLADYRESSITTTNLADFKMYRLNVWQTSSHPWKIAQRWAANRSDRTLASFRGEPCWLGADLSRARDMSALVLTFRDDSGDRPEFYQFAWAWMVREYAEKHKMKAPFLDWEAEGLIEFCDETIDMRQIEAVIVELAQAHYCREFRHDPAYANELAKRLEENHGILAVPFRQTVMQYAKPTDDFEAAVIDGSLHHDGNPVYAWEIGHAKVKSDTNNNRRIVKPTDDDYRKVDIVQAGIMSLSGAIGSEAANSVYATSKPFFAGDKD